MMMKSMFLTSVRNTGRRNHKFDSLSRMMMINNRQSNTKTITHYTTTVGCCFQVEQQELIQQHQRRHFVSSTKPCQIDIVSCVTVVLPVIKGMMTDSDTAQLLELYVELGDVVQRGDVIAQFESEKATIDFLARQGGTVTEIFAGQGDKVQVGEDLLQLCPDVENIKDIGEEGGGGRYLRG